MEKILQSISIVKAYTSEPYEVNRYRQAQERVVQTALRAAGLQGRFIFFIIFVLFSGNMVWRHPGAG